MYVVGFNRLQFVVQSYRGQKESYPRVFLNNVGCDEMTKRMWMKAYPPRDV